ncbi:MAG: di-trans,poly-cis-decaprenylcistransferase [Acholeplasmataceae bacterium]|nr:di-trans,poly-cis-decaprenylcistransferase [Acholeplasmataceae bacterium]
MKEPIPNHVAIILDGNGRWAKKRGQPRSYGHYQGALNLFRMAKEAKAMGIKMLTVFAFSTENWKRPDDEVDYLMTKPVELFEQYRDRLSELDFKVRFIGRRDRFSSALLEVIEAIETATASHQGFELVIAADYGGRDEIERAFGHRLDKNDMQGLLMQPLDVDLLIRTGGEQRISNFLLWQLAYAELMFVSVYWPAFRKRHLKNALKAYRKRHRRFGGLT